MKKIYRLLIIIFITILSLVLLILLPKYSISINIGNSIISIIQNYNVTPDNKIYNLSNTTYGTYNEAQKIIKEVLKSYYIKGPNIQYNYSKATYGTNSPEEATSQDNNYLVCAAYTYSSYVEAFGMKYSATSKMPRYNYEISDSAREYYELNKNNASKLDGNYLIYYQNKSTKDNYVYKNANTLEKIANIVKPGDLFVFTGHALVAYDVVKDENGKIIDVLLLNSTQGPFIETRITSKSTSRLTYNIFKNSNGSNGIIDIDKEGTIKWLYLSKLKQFINSGKLNCTQNECAIIRPFYEGNDGKAVFNYNIDKAKYDNSVLRTKFPGLNIEKTVRISNSKSNYNTADNGSVYIGDELTYTIKITNKSNVEKGQSKTYSKFYIEENLSDYLEYKSSNNNGKYSNNKINWEVKKLAANKSIELTYTVKVKSNLNNINKTITQEGKFYINSTSYLTTGKVTNKIIPKVTASNKTYEECYQESKSSTGLTLIDNIYKCMYNDKINVKFSDFSFTDMFDKKTGVSKKGTSDFISFNSKMNDSSKVFKNMILNKYWSGLVGLEFTNSKNEIERYPYLPSWSGSSAKERNKTITDNHFKNGDVLIYHMDYRNILGYSSTNKVETPGEVMHTNESGIYAFIYINGKFLGNNYTGTYKERNSFTSSYYDDEISIHLYQPYYDIPSSDRNTKIEFINYQTLFEKDYYVILRPEQVIKEKIETKLVKPTKIKYNKNDSSIDLTGGSLNTSYNDGSVIQTKLNDKKVSISGFDTKTSGVKTITLNYENQKYTYNIEVFEEKEESTPNPDPIKPENNTPPPSNNNNSDQIVTEEDKKEDVIVEAPIEKEDNEELIVNIILTIILIACVTATMRLAIKKKKIETNI